MPTYDYSCSECNGTFEKILSISRMNEPLEQPCPKCSKEGCITKLVGAPAMVRDTPRPDAGFREVLQKIHEKTPGSTLNSVIR